MHKRHAFKLWQLSSTTGETVSFSRELWHRHHPVLPEIQIPSCAFRDVSVATFHPLRYLTLHPDSTRISVLVLHDNVP